MYTLLLNFVLEEEEVSFKGNVYDFSVDHCAVDKLEILNIHKYLMVKSNIKQYKIMFRLIKQIFIALLTFSGSLASTVYVSNHTKCISLYNQPCMTGLTIIDLNPDKCNEELCYYPLIVNLDKFNGRCNTLDDLSVDICVANKTEDIFNMVTRINESKILTKYISC